MRARAGAWRDGAVPCPGGVCAPGHAKRDGRDRSVTAACAPPPSHLPGCQRSQLASARGISSPRSPAPGLLPRSPSSPGGPAPPGDRPRHCPPAVTHTPSPSRPARRGHSPAGGARRGGGAAGRGSSRGSPRASPSWPGPRRAAAALPRSRPPPRRARGVSPPSRAAPIPTVRPLPPLALLRALAAPHLLPRTPRTKGWARAGARDAEGRSGGGEGGRWTRRAQGREDRGRGEGDPAGHRPSRPRGRPGGRVGPQGAGNREYGERPRPLSARAPHRRELGIGPDPEVRTPLWPGLEGLAPALHRGGARFRCRYLRHLSESLDTLPWLAASWETSQVSPVLP